MVRLWWIQQQIAGSIISIHIQRYTICCCSMVIYKLFICLHRSKFGSRIDEWSTNDKRFRKPTTRITRTVWRATMIVKRAVSQFSESQQCAHIEFDICLRKRLFFFYHVQIQAQRSRARVANCHQMTYQIRHPIPVDIIIIRPAQPIIIKIQEIVSRLYHWIQLIHFGNEMTQCIC